ncbi:MAG: citramalate synthase [Candidatus Firestonebacteria bacterium]|nr:citramalate synthase [Candidatus Firestonebacteria bacterium]
MKKVILYDTTLRDGAQGEGVSFSVEEKLKVAKKLDEIGIEYIEGGWPGANPKDAEFFQKLKELKLKHSKGVAFGSTRRAKNAAKEDENLKAIVRSGAPAAAIFGKSWDLHVTEALRISLEENLKLIGDSVDYLKSHKLEVFYDAEHFFDGYKANKEYAIKTLLAAEKAGADYMVLCDTNGGCLTSEIKSILEEVKKHIKIPLGIHAHNDSDMATANTIAAVEGGAVVVEGTINGFGERCGNANLCLVIPNLQLKLGIPCLVPAKLKELTVLSIFVAEIANITLPDNMPFVGYSAFAHKGGIHVDAVKKNPKTYEHTEPELVGNKRRVLISDQSGISNVLYKAMELNLDLGKDNPASKELLKKLKELENQGYNYEDAEASFELLMKKATKTHRTFFNLEEFRVLVESKKGKIVSEAIIKVRVKGVEEHTVAEGNGPVDALNNAIRKALERFYPSLTQVHLRDFKVRIVNPKAATQAICRVIIESSDGKAIWSTVGVSANLIEASWYALVDSIEYKLLKDGVK